MAPDFVGRRPVEILVAEGNTVTVLPRRDARRSPTGRRSARRRPVRTSIDAVSARGVRFTQALGVTPGSDLRAGHANTLEWYLRSGAAAVDDALSDPLWNRTFDFGYEAEVAARVCNRLLRKDA
jgi:hypothetical protein